MHSRSICSLSLFIAIAACSTSSTTLPEAAIGGSRPGEAPLVAAKGESSDEKARRVVLDKIYEADFHDFVVTPRARLTRDALATNLRSGTDAARDWQVCNYSRSACGMYQLRTSDDSLLMLTYDGHDGNRWLHVYRGAGRRIGVATDRWDGRGAVWEDKTGWD